MTMKHTMKKLLAALVACMLLLSSVAVMAEEIPAEEQNASQPAAEAAVFDGTKDGVVTVTNYDYVGKVEVNVESSKKVNVSVGTSIDDSRTFYSESTPFKEINVTVTKVEADNNDGVTISSSATGQIENAGVINVDVINDVTASANGIVIGNSSTDKSQGGRVTVGKDFRAYPDDTASVYAPNGNAIEVHASDSEVTIENGDVKGFVDGIISDGSGSKITVENGNVIGETGDGIENLKSGVDITVNGSVKGAVDGIYSDGSGSKITVENGNVTGETRYGIKNWSSGVDITVNGSVTGGMTGVDNSYGKVTVMRDVTGKNCGVNDAYGEVTVNGSVKATGGTGSNGFAEGTGVSAGCEGAKVTVDGDVEGAVCGVKAQSGATVTVGGDVKGTDSGSVGVVADADSAGGNVIVDGTVSGKAAAIQFNSAARDGSVDLRKAQVTVWAAELNDGSAATVETKTVYEGGTTTTEIISDKEDENVAEALKKAINYIIRVAEKDNDLTLDKTEGKREVGGYKTAHEGEEVISTLVGFEEGDTLDEVYYNETTKLDASQYKLQGNSLIVTMLRGGAMNLLAKITKAVKPEETKTEEKAEETKTEETKTEETKTEETKTEETKTEETKAEETKAEETKTEETKTEETKTEETKAEETKTETATSETTTETKADDEDTAGDAAFQWEEVAQLHGVASADRPAMAGALKALADGLGEDVTVEIIDQEKLVGAKCLAAFEALPLSERLAIAMQLLGCGEAEGLSEGGAAVLSDIDAALDAMTDAEKEARQSEIDKRFLPRLIVIDGQEYEAVGIEVVITRGSEKTYERYTFYKDGGAWKLYQIEQGEYRTVGA